MDCLVYKLSVGLSSMIVQFFKLKAKISIRIVQFPPSRLDFPHGLHSF